MCGGLNPSSPNRGSSHWRPPTAGTSRPIVGPTDWRAVSGKSACTVRREGWPGDRPSLRLSGVCAPTRMCSDPRVSPHVPWRSSASPCGARESCLGPGGQRALGAGVRRSAFRRLCIPTRNGNGLGPRSTPHTRGHCPTADCGFVSGAITGTFTLSYYNCADPRLTLSHPTFT